MRPTLKSIAIAALIAGCAAAGIAVASAGTPHDRSAVPSTSPTTEPAEHATNSEAVHSGPGRHENRPTTVATTRAATRTEHANPEPADDNGDATEPGDDRGGATEPGDDNGGATEPGDDNGGATEPGDDNGGRDNRGPGGGDDSSGPSDDHSGPDRGSDG
jgi:hypothetical protein